jgi:hypothetical protein
VVRDLRRRVLARPRLVRRKLSYRFTFDDAWRRDIEAIIEAYLRDHAKGTVCVRPLPRGRLDVSVTLPDGAAYRATLRRQRAKSGRDWYAGFAEALSPGVHDRDERWAGAYLVPFDGEPPSLWPCQMKLWEREDRSLSGAVWVSDPDGREAGQRYAIIVSAGRDGTAKGHCVRTRHVFSPGPSSAA